MSTELPAFYFDTRFRLDAPAVAWPQSFAIITAYATTGDEWSETENAVADAQLEEELRVRGVWMRRITGYSPLTRHAEPGWTVALPQGHAIQLGVRYKQDAIYVVNDGQLFVTRCDVVHLHLVDQFERRVDDYPSLSPTNTG